MGYSNNTEKFDSLVSPLINIGNPQQTYFYQMPFLDWEINVNNNFTLVNHRNTYIKSGVFKTHGLTNTVNEILIDSIKTAPSTDSYILWDHVGGLVQSYDKYNN